MRAASMLALGPILFGISFGLLAKTGGMSTAAAIVFSATTFAGSAQFAAVSVLGAGGSVAAAVAAAVLLNARYAPMSVAAAPVFDGPWWKRLLEAQLIVDESWALGGRGGRFRREIMIGAGLLLYPLWIAGSAVGTIVGDRLGTPKDYGLDGAFAALFLGLAAPTLRGRRAREAAALAAVIVVALIPFVPAGVPLVAAGAACLIAVRR
jgi:4-azaleucine resistance transporter AzlC